MDKLFQLAHLNPLTSSLASHFSSIAHEKPLALHILVIINHQMQLELQGRRDQLNQLFHPAAEASCELLVSHSLDGNGDAESGEQHRAGCLCQPSLGAATSAPHEVPNVAPGPALDCRMKDVPGAKAAHSGRISS